MAVEIAVDCLATVLITRAAQRGERLRFEDVSDLCTCD